MDDEYITREAALEVVNGWREQLIPTYGENDEYVKCLETVAEHLYDIPAADVRPVRHGRWLCVVKAVVDTTGICSNCCEKAVWRTRKKPYAICPNCGADMREVDNED